MEVLQYYDVIIGGLQGKNELRISPNFVSKNKKATLLDYVTHCADVTRLFLYL